MQSRVQIKCKLIKSRVQIKCKLRTSRVQIKCKFIKSIVQSKCKLINNNNRDYTNNALGRSTLRLSKDVNVVVTGQTGQQGLSMVTVVTLVLFPLVSVRLGDLIGGCEGAWLVGVYKGGLWFRLVGVV